MTKQLQKRKRFLVHKFQYQLVVVNLLYFLTIFLIFAAVLFVPLMIEMESAGPSWNKAQGAANQFLTLHAKVWPAVLVIFILLTGHSTLVSHRIAGPLYRFRAVFKAITEGTLSNQVTIRKHDYLQQDAGVINEMIRSLRTKITGIREKHDGARAALNKLKRAVDNGSVKEMKQYVKILEAQMEELRAGVDQFRTAPEEAKAEDQQVDKVVSATA